MYPSCSIMVNELGEYIIHRVSIFLLVLQVKSCKSNNRIYIYIYIYIYICCKLADPSEG